MGLDEMVAEIDAAAAEEAGAIMNEAAGEKDRLLAEARERARRMMGDRLAEAERQIAQIRVREMAGAELEVKRARLAMERQLLSEASGAAHKRISAMMPSQDEELLGAILGKHGVRGHRIFGAKRNEQFLRTRPEYAFAGNIDCTGGVLFESPDGLERMDFTYDAILKELVERTTREIYDILFRR
jgi:V/A-type H+-transporting ATPase subunit E